MSTRSQIIFEGSDIKIYKHSDGYPEDVVPVLVPFVREFVRHRGYDVEYMLAQCVRTFMVSEEKRRVEMLEKHKDDAFIQEFYAQPDLCTGWGITTEWHTDIEYLYVVKETGDVEVRGVRFGGYKGGIEGTELLTTYSYHR